MDLFSFRSIEAPFLPLLPPPGTPADPGLMVRSLADIFREREALGRGRGGEDLAVACSYLEVYNEASAPGRRGGGGGRWPRSGQLEGLVACGLRSARVWVRGLGAAPVPRPEQAHRTCVWGV